MSSSFSELVAKLTVTSDMKSVVGEASASSAALQGLKTSANDVGNAGAAMAVKLDAARMALEGQAHAAEASNLAIAAGGDAKIAHIAYLTSLTQESQPAIASIQALSVAHAEYNATVSIARKALDDGIASQALYAAAVEGAAQKLALQRTLADTSSKAYLEQKAAAEAIGAGLIGLRKVQDDAGVSSQKLEELTQHTARAFGVGREQVMSLKLAIQALPQVIMAFPVTSAAIAATAAITGLIVAEQMYEASVRQVDVASRAHVQTLALTQKDYADLAAQIAQTADISNRSARDFEAKLLDNNVNPNTWLDLAAAARGYAVATGTDVPAAEAKLAESMAKPSDMLQELHDKFNYFDEGVVQNARQLEQHGRIMDAQAILADKLKEHFASLGGEVGTFSKVLGNLGENLSDVFDGIGKAIDSIPEDKLRQLISIALSAGDPDAQQGWLEMLSSPNSNRPAAPKPKPQQWGGVPFRLPQVTVSELGPNLTAGNMTGGLPSTPTGLIDDTLAKFKPYDTQLASLQDRLAKLKSLSGSDDATSRAGQAVVATEHQIAVVEKERTDAELKLDDATRQRLAHIKELIARGPELIAQSQLAARTAEEQLAGFFDTALARQKLNDAEAIEKANLPYTTALIGAQGDQRLKLLAIIQSNTMALRQQQAAQHELDALNDVQSRFLGLSGPNLPSFVNDDQLALQKKQLDEWKDLTLHAMHPVEAGYADFVKYVDAIFSHDYAQILTDDLARRTDWASGVKRTLDQLGIDTANWAKTSGELTQSAAQMFHDDFVEAIVSSKDPLQAFFDWFKKAMAEAIYQQYLASTFNGFAGSLVSGIGSAVSGIGGYLGISSAPVSSGWSQIGVHHMGLDSGSIANPFVTRFDDPANWNGAPRHHSGSANVVPLAPKERRVIVENDETIRTAMQEAALQRQLSRPLVAQLPASAGQGGGAAPVINFHPVNNTGTPLKVTPGKRTQNTQGGYDQEVLIDLVDNALADRQTQGKSAFGGSIAQTHQLQRAVR